MEELLKVRNLNVGFLVGRKETQVLRNVDFFVKEKEILGVIGETGCGKSVTGSAILRLLPDNAVIHGEIFYKGQDILKMGEEKFRTMRGSEISAIPQSPGTSLNPMMKIGDQITECLVHQKTDKKEAKEQVFHIFEKLHLPADESFFRKYPWELSGGMCQRVLIGMGMITHARFLVVDEPTKAIDWALRKDVAAILKSLKMDMGCSMLMITHDIAVASAIADRIAVMYCGQIVEIGETREVLKHPQHPYTKGLIDSMPSRGFHVMKGFMPAFGELTEACSFYDRCPQAGEACKKAQEFIKTESGHLVRCNRCGKDVERKERTL